MGPRGEYTARLLAAHVRHSTGGIFEVQEDWYWYRKTGTGTGRLVLVQEDWYWYRKTGTGTGRYGYPASSIV